MTPEYKEKIKHKLGCADIWDDSKMELHTMLSAAMEYISSLEAKVEELKKEHPTESERDFLMSEIGTLTGFLEKLEEDSILERIGFEYRLTEARQRLSRLELNQ